MLSGETNLTYSILLFVSRLLSVFRGKSSLPLKLIISCKSNPNFKESTGAPVAQWFKRWPTDLADRVGSSSRRNLLNHSIAQSLSLSTSHHPDMTGILLKKM